MPDELTLLEAGRCRALIDLEHGGRLASLVVEGWELLPKEGRDVWHWGSFVIAPWTGRMRHGRFAHDGREYRFPLSAPPHALHGLVVDEPWQALGPGVVAIDLQEPWPWRGRVVHSLRLEEDRLESRLELEAFEPMPAAMGWHPWFLSHLSGPDGQSMGPVELHVQPGRMYANDEGEIPSGELVPPAPHPWDFCFIELAAAPRLSWRGPEGVGLELTVESDCPCWVLYDQEPQAIAVEPWTAPPDSLNMPSPTIVTPGSPLVASMTWRWKLG